MIVLAALLWCAGLYLVLRSTLLAQDRRTESEMRFEALAGVSGLEEGTDKLKALQEEHKIGRTQQVAGWLRTRDLMQREDVRGLLERLDYELELAGRPQGWSAMEAIAWALMFWGLSIGGAIFMAAAGALPPVVFGLIVLVFGAYPPLKVRQLKKVRQDNAKAELPYLLQELRLNLSSGYSTLDDALGRTVSEALTEGTDSVLIREFARAYAEYRHGQKPREEALYQAARRIGVQSVDDFVGAIIQGLQTGAPLGQILASQADAVSRSYRQDMLQYIEGKSNSFIISVVFVMLGVLMFIGGPIFLRVLESFGSQN